MAWKIARPFIWAIVVAGAALVLQVPLTMSIIALLVIAGITDTLLYRT